MIHEYSYENNREEYTAGYLSSNIYVRLINMLKPTTQLPVLSTENSKNVQTATHHKHTLIQHLCITLKYINT